MRINCKTLFIPVFLVLNLFLQGCSSLLFFPYNEHVRKPTALGLDYQDIYLSTQDKTSIHAWFLPAKTELKGSIYFLHGNAENISTHIESVFWLPKEGYQVLLLDYRGFGKSEGEPDLPEVFQDIDSGLSWLIDNARHKPIFILGQSLGASLGLHYVATNQEAKKHLSGIISDSAFSNYADIVRYAANRTWITWGIQYPASWIMNYPYSPDQTIDLISPIPILIFHGEKDTLIPVSHGQILYDKAKEPKYFIRSQGRHIETFIEPKNRLALLKFLDVQQDNKE